MRAFMSFEWLKLRKRRLPRVILLLLVALTALAFWGQGTSGRDRVDLLLPRGWLAALIYCSFFATFFWPVLGATWAGNEYGWGTVRAVLTRRPGRRQQVLAGLAVLLLGVAAGIVVVLVTGTVGGIVVAALTGNDAWTAGVWSGNFLQVLAKGAGTAWLIASFYLLFAYAAAVVFRSAAVGIAVGIGGTLAQAVVSSIFNGLGGTWKTLAEHFPITYTNGFITRVVGEALVPGTGLASRGDGAPSAGQSVAGIAIYSAIFLLITLVVAQRRDVTA